MNKNNNFDKKKLVIIFSKYQKSVKSILRFNRKRFEKYHNTVVNYYYDC